MSEIDDLKAKLAKMQNKAAGNGGQAPAAVPSNLPAAPAQPQPPQPPQPPQAGIYPPLALLQKRGIKDAQIRPSSPWALLLARMMEMMGGLLTPKPAASGPQDEHEVTPVFTVLVAGLVNDADGAAQAHLLASLASHLGIRVQTVPRVFTLTNPEDPAQTGSVLAHLRMTIAQENGHALIWGDWTAEGYRLRFSTAQSDDGAFGLASRLDLPANFADPVPHLIYAAILASAEAVTDAQKDWVKRTLPASALAAEDLANRPPVQMSMAQQRSVQIFFGHIAMAVAGLVPPLEVAGWHDKALNAYRSAQKRISRADPLWETGMIHRHVGTLLNAKADKATDPIPSLKEAVQEWRQAVDALTRASMPQEWATAQIRLGNALYKLDLATGDSDLLREALQSLQSALQVYSRTETPLKWAEVMHDVAQVLQVYGDQSKNPEILQRAIETCEFALQVYSRDRTPLSWAAVQNTLGTALFLFDRHKGGNEHLELAAQSLEAALEMFNAHGAKAPAKVAGRNLNHVRKLAEARKGHRLVDDLDWGKPGEVE